MSNNIGIIVVITLVISAICADEWKSAAFCFYQHLVIDIKAVDGSRACAWGPLSETVSILLVESNVWTREWHPHFVIAAKST
jgi:hypothetical protein